MGSFVDCGIWSVFPNERKDVTWQLCPVSIILFLPAVSLLYVNITIFKMKTVPAARSNDLAHDSEEEILLRCRVSRQITISPFSQVAVLVKCQWEGHLFVVTQHMAARRRCSMVERQIIDILFGIPYCNCIANLSAKAGSLTRHMIIASATNAPPCLVHARGDELIIPGPSRLRSTLPTFTLPGKSSADIPTMSTDEKSMVYDEPWS